MFYATYPSGLGYIPDVQREVVTLHSMSYFCDHRLRNKDWAAVRSVGMFGPSS